jgi:hypothetical protein
MNWPMNLLDLTKKINSLTIFNKLTIKCVVGFGGFVQILDYPWQLMVRNEPF